MAGAAMLALPLSVALVAPATAEPRAATAPVTSTGEGIESDVAELAVDETSTALSAQPAPEDPFVEAGVPEGDGTVVATSGSTSGLAVVGVTWEHDTAPEGATVVVRTRTADTWSEWSVLDQEETVSTGGTTEDVGSATTELRDGTEPAFVGAVDEVEVAVRGAGDALPQDIRLVVIEPGEPDADGTVANASLVEGSESTTAPAIVDESASGFSVGASDAFAAAAAARPAINTRAQWGADESLMRWTPEVGRVNGAVVHHTAGTNNYTAAQVPSIIRGIYTYHAQSRGWGDIGYNFLVDKYGRIWEGRAGGVERAIVGAHAAGVNSHTFGLSLMGNYDQATVPAAAMDAMSRLIAWKLSLHGVRANGTGVIDGRTMPAVVGHRDVGQTACPGANLYPRLGELRSAATSHQGSAPFRSMSRSLAGDAQPDLVVERDGVVSLGSGQGWAWGSPLAISTGWTGRTLIPAGDWNRDGYGDLMWRDRGGRLYLQTRTANGWAAAKQIGQGWSGMNAIAGGYDWDGDGYPDLLARRASDGGLWLYPNNGRGGFGSARQIGWGWHSMSAITMIGNLRAGPALVARDGNGRLVTYVGDRRGGFAGTVPQGTGWNVMTALLGVGDASGDGHADLFARDRDGRLWRYLGDGQGSFWPRTEIGNSWQSFPSLVATRTGSTVDVYPVDRSGTLRRYTYSRNDRFSRTTATSVRAGTAAGTAVIASGDWDGDGRPDLMVRAADGRLLLHRGTGDGAFSPTATQIGQGWSGMASVVGAPNFVGDGRPALLALERSSGRIWLYPGDGRGGFGRSVVIGTARGADMLVSVGAWTGRASDVVTRESSALVLREGNGAGQLGSPRHIGQGWGGAASIIGVGDATRDGRPDIALVTGDGAVRLYPGDGRGGFLSSFEFGAVPRGATAS